MDITKCSRLVVYYRFSISPLLFSDGHFSSAEIKIFKIVNQQQKE